MAAIVTGPTASPALKDRYYRYRGRILRTEKQECATFDDIYWEMRAGQPPQPQPTPSSIEGTWTTS